MVLLLGACGNSRSEIDALTTKKAMVEEALNVNTLFSRDGVLKAELKAPLMLRTQGDTVLTEFPKTLHVDFFDTTGKRESWLDAKYGKYLETYNRVQLRDSVKLINLAGDTLRTQELWWDQDKRIFYTDSVVRITTKDMRVMGGRGLRSTQDLNDVTIFQPTGPVKVQSAKLPQ